MKRSNSKSNFVLVLIVYLAGIFMGAIDTGIVTPARTLIQNNLMVDDKTGIWMITIYTLAYAASIPVMGKLADRFGRKIIYMISIFLFGAGSLMCGLSHNFGSFGMLVGARAFQAIGGGGIVPVATAEFGTSFPPEKRGMALGLVGAVYGIANIFGSLAGSAILSIFGNQNWQYIFYVNVPISLFIIIAGLIVLPNNREPNTKRIDGLGIIIIVSMVLSLLYGLKNIDFFRFSETIGSTNVYPFLLAFIILLPVFILVEKKAQDPILNIRYFTNSRIVITLGLSFAAGFVLMGIVFIPQFSENALKVHSGSGGYFTVVLGFLAGVSAMLSGTLLDKIGAKRVLLLGFGISIAGALFLIFVGASYPNLFTVLLSLALLGFGLGFTMGAPVNYMMLENIQVKESNSGLATVSLIRSIGTSIAPAIMVGFIAHAGGALQTDIMNVLPNEIKVPDLPYVQQISDEVNKLKSDPNMKDKLANVDLPDLAALQTVKLDFTSTESSSFQIPSSLVEKFKSSDVTTIVSITREFAGTMFDEMSPKLITKIQGGIDSGISGIQSGLVELQKNMADLQSGYDGIGQGIAGMQAALTQQQSALSQLQSYAPMMTGSLPPGMSLLDMIPATVQSKMPDSVKAQLSGLKTADDLAAQIAALKSAITTLTDKLNSNLDSQAGMKSALDGMSAAKAEMTTLIDEMKALRDAIPAAFKSAQANYLKELEARSGQIETVYQDTLDGGYRSIYFIVAVAAALAMLLLIFYRVQKIKAKCEREECYEEFIADSAEPGQPNEKGEQHDP